jgi:cysteinyl-tRNA synthetase
MLVILQNGESILDFDDGQLVSVVSGWAVENLFYLKTTPLEENETRSRLEYLIRLNREGKFILSVDYVDDGSDSFENISRILDYYEKAKRNGCIPYAARSDLELDEMNVIEGIQPPEAVKDYESRTYR